ncbi:uncharacterized protein [Pyrus communis]|uniref:uncharacterized protein n=1 Tax=Pyrus communis TaxID=23211 RepID=UPI0035BEC6A9
MSLIFHPCHLSGQVIGDRNYAPGEHVLIRYGKFSNATLLLDFGFTLSCNIHDQVQIRAIYLIMMSFVNEVGTFEETSQTNQEVKSGMEKGKEFESLRAFARAPLLKSLGPISSPIACQRLSIRRQMARGLLNGELRLRVLKSASAWLRNDCDTLTTTDCYR